MNPIALAAASDTGHAIVTVQDHRLFCPGPGKSLPDGACCRQPMSAAACARCLDDDGYRRRTLQLTRQRAAAVAGARLLVLSRYMARELAAIGHPTAEVVPPWTEIDHAPRGAGESVLIGGRLVAHKGPDLAWQAWRRAACGLPLVVAGSGPLESQLDGARRLGWLPRDALGQALRDARALLFPSRWQEPFGILGVEALASATPVIVASGGGVGEWSDHGCIAVPAHDVAAMAAAIERLAHDPDGARRLGRQGQAMVAERFARGPIEKRLREIYQEVAGSR
jgi:glycosyltransferase involved in cell wall biosynthesis